MKRRQALERTSWILKSAIFAPSVLQALQGCHQEISITKNLQILNDSQNDLVKAISDTIIPRTQTPGASDVKVNQFMDLLLKDVFEKEVTQQFLEGLVKFDEDCLSLTDTTFAKLNRSKRHEYLEKVDQEVMEGEYGETIPFYYTFKHLTTTIYFSTEEGAKQNLNYVPIPGTYQGDIELKPGDKIMVGNNM